MIKYIFNIFKKTHIGSKLSTIGFLPRWIIFSIDLAIVAFACFTTFLTLISLNVQPKVTIGFLSQSILIFLVHAMFFVFFKTYRGIIRHSTFIDGVNLLITTASSFLALLTINYVVKMGVNIEIFRPAGLFITFVLSFVLLFLFRIFVKNVFERYLQENDSKKLLRAVIYGADSNAIAVANALKNEKPARFDVVAFIDKFQSSRTGKSILNLPILNQKNEIRDILKSVDAGAIIMTEKSLSKLETIALVEECIEQNFKVFTVPLISDWEDKKEISNRLQHFDIEDLLHRDPIVLDNQSISSQIKNKVVLISGAAGSIGSEIVRQIISFNPCEIILLDQAESPLHSLQLEILENMFDYTVKIQTVLSDIRDFKSLEKVFICYKPHFVFHAAAYKHVPIMEENPSQAIFTNVIGTKNLADLSNKYFVDKFVMISTDKAVNPSSIMGASKRIAEKYVQSLHFHLAQSKKHSATKYITTRFGNVLGSNGSIVPLFTKQIQEGGPVTITHPDIIRYFMTIPEACQLVLEAGVMGNGGEIFIFDMGKPVKIIDLAKKMIRLAGFIPDVDIKIKIIGLRPGEKLYEELLNDTSKTLSTHNIKITICQDVYDDYNDMDLAIAELIQAAKFESNEKVVEKMKEIVPEFKSMNSVFEILDK